ncbi:MULTISPECIES: PAS domain-containing hybrid sensor histidine kinase/response regulator [Deefgea]|uniref:histidine kinase n=1 Tax=Deefgea chitinilytica TaxID=570276 RepID=A0ABS2C8M3_9NEIS|nr:MULTISPECIES: CHASE domain-containing protein [Deefgea]MBM5570496.1 response regulator [Deefgea chitinilytica]MBM9887725.1 response regulator [Deefgea sp. CFH1-16]
MLEKKHNVLQQINFTLVLVASVGVFLSVLSWYFASQELQRQAQLQFERQSEPLINELKLRVKSLSLGLRGARVVPLMVNGELKPQHFRTYLATRKLTDEFPGALGFGFIRRVAPQDLDAFIAEQRVYRPEFSVKTLGENPGAKFIIQYIEPLAANRKAIGLDIASEPVRKAAAFQAMKTGEMAITAPIQLVQAGKTEPGFLILLPFYLRPLEGVEYGALQEREESLIGWVYAPVLMSKFVEGLSQLLGKHIDFEIYSGRKIERSALIYDDDGHVAKTGRTSVAQRQFSREVSIELGGQVWTVVLSSNENFIQQLDHWLPLSILVLGLLLTGMVTSALASAARLKNRAQVLAQEMSLQARRRGVQLDAVLDSTPDAIVTADRFGVIISANQALKRLFGYDSGELIGKNVSVLMGDTDAAAHHHHLERYQHHGRSSVMGKDRALWGRHADGHPIPIEVNLNQFELDGAVFLVAQIRDISQRLKSEDALRASQRQLSMIVESAGLGTWDFSVVTGEAYFGGIYGEMLGFNTSELIPNVSTWRELVHPDDLPYAVELLDVHLAGLSPIFSCELRMKTAKNAWKWVHTVGRVYERDEQGQALKMAGIHLDVDLRKRNELVVIEKDQSLRRLQQQLSSIINSATEISIIATDVCGLIEVFNIGAEKMLGYEAVEMVGLQTPAVLHDGAEVMARAEAIFEQTGDRVSGFEVFVYYAQQGMSDSKEWTYICKDGRRLTVNLMVTARHDEVGNIVGYLGVATNISEQKRINAILEAATEEAVQANRAKSDFLANMSHEIRTPMNAVIGFSNLLSDTPLNETQLDFVNSIQQSGDALLCLINDILDFSKIEAGHLELEAIEFDLRYLLEGALDIVAEKAAKQNLDLACIVDPRLPQKLIGDPGRLRQVLLNLLNNAIKFTADGEVVARVVLLERTTDQCCVRFMVKDSGIGMSAAAKEKLFKPFSQADSSTTRRFGGTGLGLSICKRLIDAMQGQIGVESEVGAGAEFWFEVTMPIAQGSAQQQVVPQNLQGKKVLVVDDFAANRELIKLQLDAFGMVTSCFDSPELALSSLQATPDEYVLALIDMQLPELDGLALAREIQKIEACAKMPLILLTSMAVPGMASDAKLAGYSAFLTKPIRQSQLIYAIEETFKMQHLPKSDQSLVTAHRLAEQIAATKPYILLAEDNPVNQKVAVLMLEKLGCRVDVAHNGQMALEAVQQNQYDVVLMDCQMPVMDGFAASRAIRELPIAAANVYIVALTANAFQSDIDHCYAAGMSDFVAKPIYLNEISQALQRGLLQSGRLIQLDSNSEKGDGMTEVNDLDLVLQLELKDITQMFAELAQAVGMDMKDELLALFFPTLDECVEGLQQAIPAADVTNVISFAHKLKGAAGQLGATRLAAYSKSVEMAAKSNDLEAAKVEFAALQALGAKISEQLRVG